MASVTLEQVTKIYSGKHAVVHAVNDLSLHVADREFVVLVGPSGCGKTTTLRLIAGLEATSSGTIRIGEDVVNEIPPKDRDVAMVFQNYALYPHMTVFQNMAFGLKMRHVPKREIQSKVAEVAELLNIESLLNRKPAALSGGERQRVALGRAIVRRPRVFLFDEPLSNLDATLRVHMRSEIKSLHRKLGATVIYVTHDQEEAMTLGNRIVVMKDGAISQCGKPLDVYNRPSSRFVGEFLGNPPMNFLTGRLERNGTALNFVTETFQFALPTSVAGPVADHTGQPLTIGIRPEHIRLDGASTDPSGGSPPAERFASCGDMVVDLIEPLGCSIHVHLASKTGERLIAKVAPSTSVTNSDTVHVRLDAAALQYFDEKTEERLG